MYHGNSKSKSTLSPSQGHRIWRPVFAIASVFALFAPPRYCRPWCSFGIFLSVEAVDAAAVGIPAFTSILPQCFTSTNLHAVAGVSVDARQLIYLICCCYRLLCWQTCSCWRPCYGSFTFDCWRSCVVVGVPGIAGIPLLKTVLTLWGSFYTLIL